MNTLVELKTGEFKQQTIKIVEVGFRTKLAKNSYKNEIIGFDINIIRPGRKSLFRVKDRKELMKVLKEHDIL